MNIIHAILQLTKISAPLTSITQLVTEFTAM